MFWVSKQLFGIALCWRPRLRSFARTNHLIVPYHDAIAGSAALPGHVRAGHLPGQVLHGRHFDGAVRGVGGGLTAEIRCHLLQRRQCSGSWRSAVLSRGGGVSKQGARSRERPWRSGGGRPGQMRQRQWWAAQLHAADHSLHSTAGRAALSNLICSIWLGTSGLPCDILSGNEMGGTGMRMSANRTPRCAAPPLPPAPAQAGEATCVGRPSAQPSIVPAFQPQSEPWPRSGENRAASAASACCPARP